MDSATQKRFVVVIPCLQPDEKLISTIQKLKAVGFEKLIIVNDGSSAKYNDIFDKALSVIGENGGVLLKHSVNLGQGRAYKTAFNYFLQEYPDAIGVLQCDSDGQHDAEDVLKCAELMIQYPNELILGVRNFDSKSVPFRSRFGNKCTSLVFKLFCGLDIDDTQTGLKGIPSSLIPYLMEAVGERYEYCSSVLLEAKKRKFTIRQFPIKTVYIDENASSHFNPIIDSIRIYSLLFKYMISSLSAFVIDIVMFSVFLSIYKAMNISAHIVIATYSAKIISCAYSYFVNKKIVFSNDDAVIKTLIRYVVLCILQASASAFVVNALCIYLGWYEVMVKVLVDTILFFISFQLQQNWVFKTNDAVKGAEEIRNVN